MIGSRLHDFTAATEACLLLFDGVNFPISCVDHMSYAVFLGLQESWKLDWMC